MWFREPTGPGSASVCRVGGQGGLGSRRSSDCALNLMYDLAKERSLLQPRSTGRQTLDHQERGRGMQGRGDHGEHEKPESFAFLSCLSYCDEDSARESSKAVHSQLVCRKAGPQRTGLRREGTLTSTAGQVTPPPSGRQGCGVVAKSHGQQVCISGPCGRVCSLPGTRGQRIPVSQSPSSSLGQNT